MLNRFATVRLEKCLSRKGCSDLEDPQSKKYTQALIRKMFGIFTALQIVWIFEIG